MPDPNRQELVPLVDRKEVSDVLAAISKARENPQIYQMISNLVSEFLGDAEIQAVEAIPDGIFKVSKTNKFEAVANVYIFLHAAEAAKSFTMSDTLPAYVFGHFSDGKVVIDSVSVDRPEAEGSGDPLA